MKLLLLAAGEGSRLKKVSEVKPLARLSGLTLLERAVKTARKAGIYDIFVVLGYKKELVEEFINKKKLPVKIIYNPDWEKGNGSSVFSAKERLKDEEKFIIAMCDHVSDGKILEKLTQINETFPLILAVDTNPPSYIDLEDATKVLYDPETGKIIQAGKNLENWNSVDTGFFLVTPEIFEALEETKEDGSLKAAVNYLASKGKAKVLPVENLFWIDVDSEEAFKKTEKILLSALIKKTDGPISTYINRKLSIPLSKILVNTGITPNQISVISFLLGLLSAFLFMFGTRFHALLAGLTAQISSIVDGCDGEVARLKLQESEFGGWFDAVLDRLSDGLIITGMGIYLIKTTAQPLLSLLITSLALIGTFLLSYTADKYDFFIKHNLVKGIRIGRDLRLFLVFLAGLTGLIFEFLIIIAAVSFAETLRRIYIAAKLAR